MSRFPLDTIVPKANWMDVGLNRFASVHIDGKAYCGVRTSFSDVEDGGQAFTVVTGDKAGVVLREPGEPAMELVPGTFVVAPSGDTTAAAEREGLAQEGTVFYERNLRRFIMASVADGHRRFWTCVWSEKPEELGLGFSGTDATANVYVGKGLTVTSNR